MTFTYDLASEDAQEKLVSRVRLELGDTTENDGVRPDGSNLSDEEIQIWLDEEGGHVGRAAAAACGALARIWARQADIAVGPQRVAYSSISKQWAEQEKSLREQHGGASRVFSAGFDRVDGYSANSDIGDYTP